MLFNTGTIVRQRYLMIRKLNGGSFGTIYLAADMQQDRLVAVKVSKTQESAIQNALLEEIKLLTKVQHPHLPQIYDYFQSDDQRLCIVIEYIPGENLQALFERRPLPALQLIVTWTAQVLEALTALHAHRPSVVHRDVKLSNIQIHSQTGQAYLLDFGIAKIGPTTVIAAYTPPFAPPEQYRRGATSPATDVYAVGVCLYMLLTGEAPPDGIDRPAQALAAPRTLRPTIPVALEQILLKALEPRSEKRYPDAGAMLAAVRSMAELQQIYATKPVPEQAAPIALAGGDRPLLARRRERVMVALRRNRVLVQQVEHLTDQLETIKQSSKPSLVAFLWSHQHFQTGGKVILAAGLLSLFVIPQYLLAQSFELILLAWGSYPLIWCLFWAVGHIRKRGWMLHRRALYRLVVCITYSLVVVLISTSLSDTLLRVLGTDDLLSFTTSVRIMITQGFLVGVAAAGISQVTSG